MMTENEFKDGLVLLGGLRRNGPMVNMLRRMGLRRGSKILERELKKVKVTGTRKREQGAPIVIGGRPDPDSYRGGTGRPEKGERIPETGTTAAIGGKRTDVDRYRVVLREEFPFLADDGCPDELKILVADMITAHAKYVKGHERLFDVAHKGNVVCFKASAEVVENYIENRSIWEELEHYKSTGKVLGKHRIFRLYEKMRALTGRTEADVKREMELIQKRIAARRLKVKANPDSSNAERWQIEIKELTETKKNLAALVKGKAGGKKSPKK